MKLIGPFKQILTLNNLPLRGKLSDEQLEIIENGGILINNDNLIEEVGDFEKLKSDFPNAPNSNLETRNLVASSCFHRLSHAHLFWRKQSQ